MTDRVPAPIGVFNYAKSYYEAATALSRIEVSSTHPEAPVRFLYIHAIELFLKSFLRTHNFNDQELASKRFSHSIKNLLETSIEKGLKLETEILEFLRKIDSEEIIENRYLKLGLKGCIDPKTGQSTFIQVDELNKSAIALMRGVAGAVAASLSPSDPSRVIRTMLQPARRRRRD